MMEGVTAARAIRRQQLDGFQPVSELNGTASGKQLRQIPGERQPRHFRSVTILVVDPPTRLDRVEIPRVERRCEERMAAIHPRVEQTHMRSPFPPICIGRPAQEIVQPFHLLRGWERIEELGGLLRASQLGDAVESQDRVLHLLERGMRQNHGALREDQIPRCHPHLQPLRQLPESGHRPLAITPDGEPNLPPQSALVCSRKYCCVVGPEGAQACRADLSNGVDQPLVVPRAPCAVPLLL